MAEYRNIMSLLVRGYSYREIEALAGCSHRTIAKARQALDAEGYTTDAQVKVLPAEDLDRLFTDGRKPVPGAFVPVDVEAVAVARIGRKKPPLRSCGPATSTPPQEDPNGSMGMSGSARSLPSMSVFTT